MNATTGDFDSGTAEVHTASDLIDLLRAPFVDADRGPATPLRYAVRLLDVLRRQAPAYRAAERARPGRDWLTKLAAAAEPGVRALLGTSVPIPTPSDERIEPLRAWVMEQQDENVAALLLAKAVARAIESVDWGGDGQPMLTLWDQLHLYYGLQPQGTELRTRPLGPGDPVPVCSSVFGSNGSDRRGAYGTSPRNLPRWRSPERLGRIILAPASVTDFRLRLDLSLEEELNVLQSSCRRLATVHPTGSIKDIAYQAFLDTGRFNDVRPRAALDEVAELAFADRVGAAVDDAVRAEARVVVVPELTQTEASTARLVQRWQQMQSHRRTDGAGTPVDAGPVLLVAGSHHTGDRTKAQRNTATIVGYGEPVTITKSVPFVHTVAAVPGDVDAGSVDLVEWLPFETEPELVVFCSQQMTMMVFVCVDFLADPLRDLARDLDVTLLLIPSMTNKSRVFTGLIAGHVAATQSTVVMANALKSRDEHARGTIGHPGFRTPLVLDHQWDADADGDHGVAIIRLPTDERDGWISTSEPPLVSN